MEVDGRKLSFLIGWFWGEPCYFSGVYTHQFQQTPLAVLSFDLSQSQIWLRSNFCESIPLQCNRSGFVREKSRCWIFQKCWQTVDLTKLVYILDLSDVTRRYVLPAFEMRLFIWFSSVCIGAFSVVLLECKAQDVATQTSARPVPTFQSFFRDDLRWQLGYLNMGTLWKGLIWLHIVY